MVKCRTTDSLCSSLTQSKYENLLLTRGHIITVIERADNTITIAEIKFNALKEYTITKEEYTKIINRAGVFQEETKTKKRIQIIMITTFGVSKNSYLSCIQNSITIDDIFNAK